MEKQKALQALEQKIRSLVKEGEEQSAALHYLQNEVLGSKRLQATAEAQTGFIKNISDEVIKNCGADPKKPDVDKVIRCINKQHAEIMETIEILKKKITPLVEQEKQKRRDLFMLRDVMVALGCEIPKSEALPTFSEQALSSVKEKTGQKTTPPLQQTAATSSAGNPFVGKWNGTAKFIKSTTPELVGITQPFVLEIYNEGASLGIRMQNNTMCTPEKCQTKIEGNQIKVEYIGPPFNALATTANAQVTFRLEAAINNKQLTGQILSHATTSIAGQNGVAEFLMSVGLQKQ